MRAPDGRADPDLIAQLLADPQRFEFFQAVRLALQWFAEQGVDPQQALTQRIRFRNSLSLGFPASQIEALELEQEPGAPCRLHITPAFMGLLGAHGALPAHYTERIRAWEAAQHDEAPRAFLDLLSNRMLALFYQAWRKYRVEHAIADGRDGFRPLLLALAGCGDGGRGVPGEAALASYAGLLQQRPLSSVALGRILSDYLGVAFTVEEMVDYWDPMAPSEQTALGRANAHLGGDAVAGARGWRPDLRVRLWVGPLDRAAYERFLPGRAGAAALGQMLELFAMPTLVYEVALLLRADQVGPTRLGGPSPGQGRLGLDCFMLRGPGAQDRADLRYDLRPLAPLAAA
jgi:type VI secretion system protein ImpH